MRKKNEKLEALLCRNNALAIAFSGGVDSVFLAAMAKKILGDKVVLLTLVSDFQSKQDTDHAIHMAVELGLSHELINFDPWMDEALVQNDKDRCYLCKQRGFLLLRMAADRRGISALAHGVNKDDLSDYRPGLQATHELGIISPLLDAGLTKEEIRMASREMELKTWNMPSQSCLATRVPYGEKLTKLKLQQINNAEVALEQFGFAGVRVRYHGDLARIESNAEDIEKISSLAYRKKIAEALHAVGFKFISLDLEGYASGSMNRVLNKDG
ncbi:MAG: ATP-dependent sacrificial sulfur transferase LarE [Desulfobacterium sp.]